jgi:hypothetical protein
MEAERDNCHNISLRHHSNIEIVNHSYYLKD